MFRQWSRDWHPKAWTQRWLVFSAIAATVHIAAVIAVTVFVVFFATAAAGYGVSLNRWIGSALTLIIASIFAGSVSLWVGMMTFVWAYDRQPTLLRVLWFLWILLGMPVGALTYYGLVYRRYIREYCLIVVPETNH